MSNSTLLTEHLKPGFAELGLLTLSPVPFAPLDVNALDNQAASTYWTKVCIDGAPGSL